jgi:hypothetical protein
MVEQRTLYLAPDPASPFIDLTHRLSHDFGVLPYAGRYSTVDPHLTVAQCGARDMLEVAATTPARHLPIHAQAHEAWLMIGHAQHGWLLHQRFPLAAM